MSVGVDPRIAAPKVKLVDSDGEPLESQWHVLQIPLLLELLAYRFRDRNDYFAGGNMFIYFSEEQARNRDYRGPDVFYVDGVNRLPLRPYWAVWREGGRYPDVIVELLSATTAQTDRTTKKALYERTFKTHEYFCYDPETERLEGWRLGPRGRYLVIKPDERGWLWVEEFELWLGTWKGHFQGYDAVWLRLFDANGNPIPTSAEAAEAEAARLREQLKELKQGPQPAK